MNISLKGFTFFVHLSKSLVYVEIYKTTDWIEKLNTQPIVIREKFISHSVRQQIHNLSQELQNSLYKYINSIM